MIEQINAELLKLQKELNSFSQAIDHIKKSGELSKEVIDAAKNLQGAFKENLDKILSLFSDYMNKTYKHTEENINKIFISFQERMKEEEELLNKFTELSLQSENLTQEFIKKISSDYEKQINKLIESAEQNLTELREYFQLQIKNMQTELDKLIKNHNNRLDTEQKILDSYLDLSKATAELSSYLKSIDFPEKLKQIDDKIQNLKKQTSNIEAKLHSIEQELNATKEIANNIFNDQTNKKILENTQNLNEFSKNTIFNTISEIKTSLDDKTNQLQKKTSKIQTLVLIILIFVIVYSFSLTFVFFYFFPDFFTTLFGN